MKAGEGRDTVFYDGQCGLCQGFVRFILPRDKKALFRFAPLQGETFANAVKPHQRGALPDSLVLLTPSGDVLVRSAAVTHVLRRLGGPYRLISVLASAVPRPWRDRLYDFIARRRASWFKPPPALCPVVPENLRARFLP